MPEKKERANPADRNTATFVIKYFLLTMLGFLLAEAGRLLPDLNLALLCALAGGAIVLYSFYVVLRRGFGLR